MTGQWPFYLIRHIAACGARFSVLSLAFSLLHSVEYIKLSHLERNFLRERIYLHMFDYFWWDFAYQLWKILRCDNFSPSLNLPNCDITALDEAFPRSHQKIYVMTSQARPGCGTHFTQIASTLSPGGPPPLYRTPLARSHVPRPTSPWRRLVVGGIPFHRQLPSKTCQVCGWDCAKW